ncbi:substrate-binding periplasmic protein [Endozoicomonas ascidiicola]|uniref:substrate-binding periplasmic protein n=1 Tax=Endozoicomonas ascidiicola TaxID=1698521 RepID=UPI00082E54C0|nr:transporter substrate-binding domain-containing protein [Endozoicomonas ascidiicola]
MRKITVFVFLALLSGQLPAKVSDVCKEVVLTGHPDLPPVSWGDYQNTHGAASDLVTEILEEEGINVINDFFGGANRVTYKLRQGIIQINPAMPYQQNHLNDIYYIYPPIYTQSYMVVTRRDQEHKISDWSDMIDLKGVAPRNVRFSKAFSQYAADNLLIVKTFNAQQGLKMLSVGRVDYAVYPQIQGDLFVSLLDLEGKLEKMPVELSNFDLYVAISKEMGCSLPVNSISKKLTERQESGYADKVFNDSLYKWMGFSLEKRNTSPN